MINIFEKYSRLTDEEKEDLEDLYIVHQLYKQLENFNDVDLTKLEYKILFNKAKECFEFSNIDVREIIKRMLEILKCVDKRLSEHLTNKGAKYTKLHQSEKLEVVWRSKDKSLACKLEYHIKQLTKKQKENIINGEKLSSYLKGKIDCRRYYRIKRVEE